MSETSLIIGPILRWLMPNAAPDTIQTMHQYVRKTAHFTEYAVLGFLVCRAVSVAASPTWRNWRFSLALLLPILIACLDEFNQSFEPSRTSSIYDVLLDITGAAAMLLFLYFIGYKHSVGRERQIP